MGHELEPNGQSYDVQLGKSADFVLYSLTWDVFYNFVAVPQHRTWINCTHPPIRGARVWKQLRH